MFKKGRIAWNKGLTKETDERVAKMASTRSSQIGILSPAYIDGKYIKEYFCKECGIKISFTGGLGSGLCGKCWAKFRFSVPENNTMFGVSRYLEKNPNWKNGKSFEPYPLGWNKTFKEQIRFRDGYKCQICGVPEVECRRKLDIHHIDYDKKNLDIKNLISLCISCHLKTNGNRKYWIQYFRENFYAIK
jgi:hypothetical protein